MLELEHHRAEEDVDDGLEDETSGVHLDPRRRVHSRSKFLAAL